MVEFEGMGNLGRSMWDFGVIKGASGKTEFCWIRKGLGKREYTCHEGEANGTGAGDNTELETSMEL